MKKTLVVVNSEKALTPEQRQPLHAHLDRLKEYGYVVLVLEPGLTIETIHDPED